MARAQATERGGAAKDLGEPAAGELPAALPGDRILVLAPHPDDESVGTGGLLALAARARAATRVVFATSGENNPWAQRAFERRLLIDTRDRIRFGVHREIETAAALERLGLPGDSAVFLRLADQGLTSLLLHDPAALVGRVAAEIEAFRPTVVATPWAGDLHPDHSALAVATSMALRRARDRGVAPPHAVAYLVHNPPARGSGELALAVDPAAKAAKRAAIACHHSQLLWRGAFMRSFAEAPERYFEETVAGGGGPFPIRGVAWRAERVRVEIRPRLRLRAPGPRTLAILGASGSAPGYEIRVPLWSGTLPVQVSGTGESAGEARFTGGPRGGELDLPATLLAGDTSAYFKLQRRLGFFDEAGWVVARRGEETAWA